MKPERSEVRRELEMSPRDIGWTFINRWFIEDIFTEVTLDSVLLEKVGRTLQHIGRTFPVDTRVHYSVLHLEDLQKDRDNDWEGGDYRQFKNMWSRIRATLNFDILNIPKGKTVPIRKNDLLVTTPLAQAKDHVKEAEDAIALYQRSGKVDYYWRKYWPMPKNLKVGSKIFYVDNRAIRGFAVVTDIVVDNFHEAHMAVDTWRWIKPIHCDYDRLKPPQGYSYATEHDYLAGVKAVRVIGGWLDPMPGKL